LTKYSVHRFLVRHEQGATHMADGYARASGKVGVALACGSPRLKTASSRLFSGV